jgi:hypothetical protein
MSGGLMKARSAFVVVGLAAASLLASTPATAAPIDKGHYHDVFTFSFNCGETPVQADVDAYGNFLFNQRGSGPFPYYRESQRATVVYTNLDTGGTFTVLFTAAGQDHKIVDNGDGTITITTFDAGGSRYYDQNGQLVLKDSGQVEVAVDVNFNGTPGNPDDDQEVPDSFRIIRLSTGTNDTQNRDFCADLLQFTT